jgi:hypothetical protein
MSEVTEVQVKKKKINGKAKGNGFERIIAKKLSTFLAPLEFRRSQSSGAILGGKNSKHLEKFSAEIRALFVGDVTPTNEADVLKAEGWKFRFSIECKSYKSVDTLQHLLDDSKIYGWFDQATTDAEKLNKEPILIIKFNRTDLFAVLDQKTNINEADFGNIITIQTKTNDRKMIIVKFDDLLKNKEWWSQ